MVNRNATNKPNTRSHLAATQLGLRDLDNTQTASGRTLDAFTSPDPITDSPNTQNNQPTPEPSSDIVMASHPSSNEGTALGSDAPGPSNSNAFAPAEPLPYGELADDELDRRVREARARHVNQKKRSYLQALERGEDPPYNPDLSASPSPGRDLNDTSKRPRGESWGKINVPTPRYQGRNWSELQAFLTDLEAIFTTAPGHFTADAPRVVYASTGIQGDTKRRWTTFLQLSGGIEQVTWEAAKQWLKDQMADPPTRCYDATRKLDGLYQRNQQSCRTFLDLWEAAEAELPTLDPELSRVCRVLHRLQPSHRERLVSSGIPATWHALRHEAVIVDSLIGTTSTPHAGPRRQEGNLQQPPQSTSIHEKGHEEGAASSPIIRRGIECWRCGGPHLRTECKEPPCTSGLASHTTENHQAYQQKQWPPPVRDGYGFQQRGSGERPNNPNHDPGPDSMLAFELCSVSAVFLG